MVRVSVHTNNQFTSLLSLLKTSFVCILLVVVSLAISKDAQELVLNPLEGLMEKLNRMAVDPFQVIFFTEDDNSMSTSVKQLKNEKKYETKVLDEAITKIGTLLVLGFGEAGSYIVSKNLSQFGNI